MPKQDFMLGRWGIYLEKALILREASDTWDLHRELKFENAIETIKQQIFEVAETTTLEMDSD